MTGGGSRVVLNAAQAQVVTATSGGLVVTDNTDAVLTGGTAAAGTNMTLNNAGASFASNTTGAPVRVTGVADGVAPFDAVNVRQLRDLEQFLSRGIAASTAAANIPIPEPGKAFSFGIGLGHFNSQTAIAVGGSFRFSDSGRIQASVATDFGSGRSKPVIGVGAGWSW